MSVRSTRERITRPIVIKFWAHVSTKSICRSLNFSFDEKLLVGSEISPKFCILSFSLSLTVLSEMVSNLRERNFQLYFSNVCAMRFNEITNLKSYGKFMVKNHIISKFVV